MAGRGKFADGGDDYLVKCFSLADLPALGRRIETIVKQTILRVGDLAVT